MLLGMKPDNFWIETETGLLNVPDTILGISVHNLTKNGLYSALIGLNILEGGENKYESTRLVKK